MSELKDKIDSITNKIQLGQNVMYDGREYKPTALVKKYTKDGWLYSVRWIESKSNSIIEVRVIDIE